MLAVSEGEHLFGIAPDASSGGHTLRPVATATPTVQRAGGNLDPQQVTAWLTLAVIATVPLITGPIVWVAPGGTGDFNQRVSISPYDLPLLLLVVVSGADLIERRSPDGFEKQRTPARLLAVAAIIWCAAAIAVHPSWRAVDWVFHVAGAAAIVRTFALADDRNRDRLLGAVVVLGVLQAALGIAQSRHGEILGLGPLEWKAELHEFGDNASGRGSLTHPYHLAALLTVALPAACVLLIRTTSTARRRALPLGIFVIAMALPITFSRAALLSLAPIIIVLARSPVLRRMVLPAVFVGLIAGASLGLSGLSSKADRSTSVTAVDSGRRERFQEAGRLIAEEPLFGVGPGRYVIALRDVEHTDLLPAHNVIAHAAAESGVLGGVLVAALGSSFALWVWRRGPLVILAASGLVPFFLLDAYPYVFPVGLVISGLWIGVIVTASETDGASP